MLTLKNVSKEYPLGGGEFFKALKNINLAINTGEFTSIMGPSGSGKSTLIHIIGLLDKPTSGDLFVEEKNIKDLDDNAMSSLRNEFVGFVFQQFNLITKLTVLENVLLPTIYARNKLDYSPEQKGQELLRRFGIAEKANSFPNKISGGQQQRVAIARALITSPKLILADEPTGNLDSKTGQEIMKLLKELNEEDRLTILVVTHEKEIAKYTRRKIIIRDGEIVS